MAIDVVGSYDSRYSAFNTAMTDFMSAHHVQAGLLNIRRGGADKITVGYLDHSVSAPGFGPDSMMRIMSITKMMVRVIVKGVAADHGIDLEGHVPIYDLVGPPMMVFDAESQVHSWPRWRGITLTELYQHWSGLRGLNDTPGTFDMRSVGAHQGRSVASLTDVLAYNVRNVAVDAAPPADYSYCNFNYQVLVAWCVQMTKLDFPALLEKYVTSHMTDKDLLPAYAMRSLRHPREAIAYDAAGQADGPTAYDATRTSGQLNVSATAGGDGFLEEAVPGSSGLIATTRALTDFAEHFDTDGNRVSGAGGGQAFYGSYTGSRSGLVWRDGQTRFAWIFNRRETGAAGDTGTDWDALRTTLDGVCQTFDTSGWP